MTDKKLPPMTIETERLVLRAPQPNEILAVREALTESIEELKRWWHQTIPTQAEAEELSYRLRVMFYNRDAFTWRIYRKTDNQLIGSLDVHSWDWEIPKAELGYWLKNSAVGNGYITEALTKVIEVIAQELELRRLEIRCDTRNLSAISVAKRIGFTEEGIMRSLERDTQGQLCDILLLAKIYSDTTTE